MTTTVGVATGAAGLAAAAVVGDGAGVACGVAGAGVGVACPPAQLAKRPAAAVETKSVIT